MSLDYLNYNSNSIMNNMKDQNETAIFVYFAYLLIGIIIIMVLL